MADSLGKTGVAGEKPGEKSSVLAVALAVGASDAPEGEGLPAGAFPAARSAIEGKRGLSAKAKEGIAVLVCVALVCFGVSAAAFAGAFGGADGLGSAGALSAEPQQPAGDSAGSDEISEGETGSASADESSASGAADGSAAGASSGAAASASESASSGSSSASGSSSGSSQASSGLISVHVSVTSSAVGGSVSGGGSFSFKEGATAYDALCACGLSVSASSTAYGVYVAAIGGLAEKEHGASSGWMYSVNGKTPMTSCSSYRLSDGDSVSWYYSVG